MLDKLKEDLKTQIDEADWSMLKVHHENGTVFIVKDNLELVDAAAAVAADKIDFVKIWLDNGELYRPSESDIEKFSKEEFKKMCKFIIVQPYVLIQLL